MEFIKNIKQIILYGLIPLININIIFSSSENSEVVTLDKLPLLNVSEENNIINNNDNNNELDSGKDFEGLSEDILKNINKDSEIKEMTQKNNLQILNILEKRKIIYDHVIGTFHKEDERSYLKNKKLATDIIYERLFYNCCFFLTINMPRWLYILGNVFCWFSLFVSSFLCGLSVSMVYTNKNDGTVDKQDKELFPIYTAIILFITIINGFIGYKYGASGYGLFLNMILYPTVAYIIPIIQSFVFFVFPRESYFSENIKLYISTTIANILVLILMGIRLINLFFVSINQKKIKFIETLIKDYITKYSLDYVFTSINFNIVYLMLVFYFLVCFVSILGIVKVVYIIICYNNNNNNKENNNINKSKESINKVIGYTPLSKTTIKEGNESIFVYQIAKHDNKAIYAKKNGLVNFDYNNGEKNIKLYQIISVDFKGTPIISSNEPYGRLVLKKTKTVATELETFCEIVYITGTESPLLCNSKGELFRKNDSKANTNTQEVRVYLSEENEFLFFAIEINKKNQQETQILLSLNEHNELPVTTGNFNDINENNEFSADNKLL